VNQSYPTVIPLLPTWTPHQKEDEPAGAGVVLLRLQKDKSPDNEKT
jgi:hypothetical protein